MSIRFIEDTIKAYKEVITSECEAERERFFRIALEHVEREARHRAVNEIYNLANTVHNQKHYE